MQPRFKPEGVPLDLFEAKRELSTRRLGATTMSPRAWVKKVRVEDAVRQSDNHLHAVGVGRKIVAGKSTETLCVRLYVTHKVARGLLPSRSRLPESIAGLPTDVVEAAPAFLAAQHKCTHRRLLEQRPAQGGISGAHASIEAGTLAARCISRKPEEQGMWFVLGNCHTLADFGTALAGSPILQPSSNDGGTVDANRFAELHRFVRLLEGSESVNHVDAAIAKLSSQASMGAGVCTVGEIQGTANALNGMLVQKHGRTTGITTGVVDDVSVDAIIPLDRENPTRVAIFVNQIRVLPRVALFAQPGDSGSLILTKPGNAALGLLFACPDNGSFAYASPIHSVLDSLEIELG
ncbi:MAG: S1 family peptidase [Gammaproteobacteria bacterium]|nr:S1 family peptidase [Gammaproteobacteria bacterium]